MARFTGIPDIPEGLGQEWAPQLIGALKQNVELLAGIRGEIDRASAAVLRGDVEVNRLPPPNLQTLSFETYAPEFERHEVTAEGRGFEIEGRQVASLDDYAKLIEDVFAIVNDTQILSNDTQRVANNTQRLANDLSRLAEDVSALRRAVDELTNQLR